MRVFRVFVVAGLWALWLLAAAGAVQAADRPAAFMRSVGNQLVAAARAGSPYQMADVIRRHGDLSYIGMYSLGSYSNSLPSSRRTSYYDGVARFMGRYFIGQSRRYPVVRFDVLTPSRRTTAGYEVETRAMLRGGTNYTLRWLVVPRRGTFKVRDVSILGVWITPISLANQQQNLFESYISENNGNVKALLAALGS